jgi:hypothetical protein
MSSDALRNAIARAAREAVFGNTSKTVKLPLKDIPPLDELTAPTSVQSRAMRDALRAKYRRK